MAEMRYCVFKCDFSLCLLCLCCTFHSLVVSAIQIKLAKRTIFRNKVIKSVSVDSLLYLSRGTSGTSDHYITETNSRLCLHRPGSVWSACLPRLSLLTHGCSCCTYQCCGVNSAARSPELLSVCGLPLRPRSQSAALIRAPLSCGSAAL